MHKKQATETNVSKVRWHEGSLLCWESIGGGVERLINFTANRHVYGSIWPVSTFGPSKRFEGRLNDPNRRAERPTFDTADQARDWVEDQSDVSLLG